MIKQKRYSVVLCGILVLWPLLGWGQQALSLSEALALALKHNYDIQLAGNDREVARLNNTPGNAGMLPTIELTGTGTLSHNNTKLVQSTGVEKEYSGLVTKTLNGGLQLNWTLYDGGKMFVTKRKLNEIQIQGEQTYREKVLQTIYEVTAAYYDLVRQKQQVLALEAAKSYNQEQLKIATAGLEAGRLARTDVLQSKIDLNVTEENILSQRYTLSVAQKTLNVWLGKSDFTDFNPTDAMQVSYMPDSVQLHQKLSESNPALLALRHSIEAAKLALQESRAEYLPTFTLRAGYYASYTSNPVGFTTSNRSLGPQLTGTLSVPLYNAGETKRKLSLARMDTLSANYELLRMKQELQTVLANALSDFRNQQSLLKIETENNELARENMEISVERLRQGQTTSLEVHQAREFYVQSSTRLTNFQYSLKLAEIRLRQLVADL